MQQKQFGKTYSIYGVRPTTATVTGSLPGTAPRRPLLPVLGPLVALVVMTGVWRSGQMLLSLSKGAGAAQILSSASLLSSKKTATESTITGYADAAKLARAGHDAEALAKLRSLEGAPLVIDRGNFQSPEMSVSSPSVHLMRAIDTFTARAKNAAKAGDAEGAGRWLDACQSLSSHVARVDHPTIEALTTLHYVDDHIARTRLEIMSNSSDGGPVARILEGQRTALNRFWRNSVVTELSSSLAIARPELARSASDSAEILAAQEQADGALAARLMTRYLAEQARLQATASTEGLAPLLPPSV